MACRILIAGCGDLGSAVAHRLDSQRFEVHGLRRGDKPLPEGVHVIRADVTDAASLTGLSSLKPAILLYCVAASAQTDENYKAHYVDGLRNMLDALDKTALRHVFFVSSTRVYGQQTEEWLEESSPAIPADFGGERLLQAERLLDGLTSGATILRLSGIYGPGRTRLIRLAREPQHWPQQNAWTNRIHRDDAAGFIAHLIERAASGEKPQRCYIVTDQRPAPQHEVLHWLARQLNVDAAAQPPLPVSGGKRLSNHRMLAEGYRLIYPDYASGYAGLLTSTEA